MDENNDDKNIVIAIDSTRIRVTNRCQWLRDKWNVCIRNKRKGYLSKDPYYCGEYNDQRYPCFKSYK